MKQWVLLTGASQGIGYEFAKLFAADGYNLVILARDQPRLQQVADELAGTGVTVTVLCPGLTHSQFHARAGLTRKHGLFMNADEVARDGYRALMKGKPIIVSGFLNKLGANVAKALPTRLTTRLAG